MKKITAIHDPPPGHWVGDGFPVQSLFSYGDHGSALSPFILLDHAGPQNFEPASRKRGVGEHPHRGFETVTIVYEGEVAHRDSTGKGGTIGPGDVQWMTAASGILHEEFHSEAFTKQGGTLHMVQLWVNLPAKDKMTTPGYQGIVATDIPRVALPGGATLRLIAGNYEGVRGPAHTFSPMVVGDASLPAGATTQLSFNAGWSAALVVLKGAVKINAQTEARAAQLVMLDSDAGEVELQAVTSEALVLALSGEPLGEPVAGYGPFVMNTREEIKRAMDDFNSGRFGQI